MIYDLEFKNEVIFDRKYPYPIKTGKNRIELRGEIDDVALSELLSWIEKHAPKSPEPENKIQEIERRLAQVEKALQG